MKEWREGRGMGGAGDHVVHTGGPGRENVTVEQQVVTPSKRFARLGSDNPS